jgi:hypothetical protein
MNYEMLKGNVGHRVKLSPPAMHLDPSGRQLPYRNEDWIIASVTRDGVQLDEATMMGLTIKLGLDLVHRYDSDAQRTVAGGIQCGMLMLGVQLYVQNSQIIYRQCSRPGETMPPLQVGPERKAVSMDFVRVSGIQARQETAGYRTHWCRESQFAERQLEGWKLVVENDEHGMPATFYVKGRGGEEDMLYVRRRQTPA